MRILISNDDGYRCRGIHVLRDIASRYGDPVVIAPDRDRSGVSSAITLYEPLRLRPVDGENCYELSGTPTDCIYIGRNHLLRDDPPDLVLSGINPGPNLGWDTLYSGTAAAAREGVLQGIPSIAFSLMPAKEMPYEAVAPWIAHVIEQAIANPPGPFVSLNVNIPNPSNGPIRGIRATHVGERYYSKDVEVRRDPRGGDYLWIGGRDVSMPDRPGSDCNAVTDRMVSVTPLGCDLTSHASIKNMTNWNYDGELS